MTIIATGFENKEDPDIDLKEVQSEKITLADVAPVFEAPREEPVAAPAQAAPVAEPVAEPAPVVHAPKYDTAGEDSSISEDDFDAIMSIFKNRARRDGNR